MEFQEISSIACIHGRFQPFHYGHVDYLKEALNIWPKIIIGLTALKPINEALPGSEHRANATSNPFTYWERMTLIKFALDDINVNHEDISFIPFPIDEPENLVYSIPKSITCATTDLYEWNKEKIKRLNKYGFSTHVLKKCVKMDFDGSTIRKLIIDGNEEWKKYVPPSTITLIEKWDIQKRLLKLNRELDLKDAL